MLTRSHAIDSSIFLARRNHLLASLPDNSAVLVASGKEQIRNRDVEHPFRATSDFYYLTGFSEPDAILCLLKLTNSKLSQQQVLFLRPKDPIQETWQGRRLGVENAAKSLQIDQAWSIEAFSKQSLILCEGVEQLYLSFDQLSDWMPIADDIIAAQKAKNRQGVVAPSQLNDLDSLLHETRLIKSAVEIEWLRHAAQISVQGHLKAMQATRPGQFEYQVQAELEAEFKRQGSPRVAFSSIVASGENACILHYTENESLIQEGALVLIDAGAEFASYAGDITQTFPASGRFSSAQAQLYQLVLDAQNAAKAVIQPGVRYDVVHQASVKVITEGLCQLGILQGAIDTLIKEEAYKAFFMHGTGHWLGMDVHDVGAYKQLGEWRTLQPGMVLTVEPGLYIAPETEGVDACYWGIGIRIEDDVLVTETGFEVLSVGLPRTIEEIESWMQQH